MTRPSSAWALCAALAACIGSSTSPTPRVMLDPILDSLFVGDKIPPPAVTYFDGTSTQTPPPSQIVWSSSDATIMAVDPATGQITGRQRGLAVVIATINNTQAGALIVVSDVVDITLLADALYLLPNDTITIPTIILHKDPTPPTVSYDPSPDPTVYTVDASGLVRATAATTSGPVSYTVHAGTAQASGAVYVGSEQRGRRQLHLQRAARRAGPRRRPRPGLELPTHWRERPSAPNHARGGHDLGAAGPGPPDPPPGGPRPRPPRHDQPPRGRRAGPSAPCFLP